MSFIIEAFIAEIISISFFIILIYFIVRCYNYFKKNEKRISQLETDFIKLQEKLNKE
ncbi:hypothetical protein [Paenibacillus popilliae]|uniref:Formate/nitrite family of transporter n=1 Tax=Paenibacillus popilliae ATCC 14706 TaxID=1212764 RepID=M9M2R9_PAEPP|nr:hypothetical protein [Paenibacillus popilliae]GAC41468.1 formate/nitrite family of transporter [Paenibacillus popilliae ATCC 14706]